MLGNNEIMAKNIKYYMELNNRSRNDVCRDLDIKYSTFSDWINGKKYPRIDKIELMSNYFGITKADLVEDKCDNNIVQHALTPDQVTLLTNYNKLNDTGKGKARDYVEDLSEQKKYRE